MKHISLYCLGIRFANVLMETIFPTKCLSCGEFIALSQSDRFFHQSYRFLISETVYPYQISFNQVMASYVCSECMADFLLVKSPFCDTCGIMFPNTQLKNSICPTCSGYPRHFRMARSYGVYGYVLEKLIHQYKYQNKIQLAKPFGILTFLTFLTYWDPKTVDIILPVPLHVKKLRQRGFNQAYAMIMKWHVIADILKIDISHIQMNSEILIRHRYTKSQIQMSRSQRQQNIKNAFDVVQPSVIVGKSILLVDDVLTTGSTADECAKTLLSYGAKKVDVLTLAQTMLDTPDHFGK